MRKIRLSELPESKEFMKHAKIADGLTKETGLEHGFIFCKPKDKIIVDKMCVGGECAIDISPEECGKHDNFFHTHPKTSRLSFSVGDKYANIYKAYNSDKNIISCLKAENNDNIMCEVAEPPSKENMKILSNTYDEIREEAMSLPISDESRKKLNDFEDKVNEATKHLQMIFDSKTKKVSSVRCLW